MDKRMGGGGWSPTWGGHGGTKCGQTKQPNTKLHNYNAVRSLFREMQEWGVIPPGFDPYRSFTPPRSVAAVVGSIPRVIEDDIWAKLLWAGLNLPPEDVARSRGSTGEIRTFYPIEMTRAIALVWLFCGLRRDEIRRLRVGWIRWQQKEAMTVCLLDVPVHKTGAAFTKPIDQAVGQAVNAWEEVKSPQAKLGDYH